MARVLTDAQRASLAAGRAKANENRRREKARRETGLDVEPEPATAPGADAPPLDTPPADSAPRQPRAGAGRSAGSPAAPRTPSLAKIRAGLVSLFTMTGVGLSMVDPYDGQVVAMNAGRLADSWADLAAQDARVRRALEALLAGSAWGTAITTTAMVALPIAAHHRLAPPEVAAMAAQAGVVVPTLGMEQAEAPEVRVERQPRAAEPSPGDPLANGHAQSQAPAATAPLPESEEVAAWAGSSDVPPIDAGGVDFPPRPPAPPSG